ncbi:MAG: hypothetical protein E7378_04765 [Clostridiales bacterium]|nr:hypothetical protein [Clostridiales bacterium]
MIGIIDSGSGGINVITECTKYYNEDFVYLVDNKNCPYGNKPKKIVKQIVIDNINFLIKTYDVDFIILACNTASGILDHNKMLEYKTPILKTKPNFDNINSKQKYLLFATKNTIKNSPYVKYYLANYKNIKTLHIKNLPKQIDENLANNNKKNQKKLIKMLKNAFFNKNKFKSIKILSLGCTHFKHIQNELFDIFNKKVKILNCENNVAKLSKFLVRKNKNKSSIKVIMTKDDQKLKQAILKMLS